MTFFFGTIMEDPNLSLKDVEEYINYCVAWVIVSSGIQLPLLHTTQTPCITLHYICTIPLHTIITKQNFDDS